MSSNSPPIDWTPMMIGLAAGVLSRMLSLKSGRRDYPGYPSGYVIQVAMALIAALIGAAIVTSLVAKQLTAATFLTLAATQFYNLRQAERNTLDKEEQLILVPRGPSYIEGIARTYEARAFLAMLVALAVSGLTAWAGVVPGVLGGLGILVLSQQMMAGAVVGDVIDVTPGTIRFTKESLLYVDDVMLMEIGLPHSRQRWMAEGYGVILSPKGPRGQAVLWNLAQRQAITHEAVTAVGVQKDVGYPEQGALTRMELPNATGRAALGVIPVDRDMAKLVKAIRQTPLLESGKWNRISSPVLVQGPMGGAGS